jgi:formylglycine-generating enzyme required for sulfatase activity
MRRTTASTLAIALCGILSNSGIGAAQVPPDGMVLVPAGEFWMGRTHFFLIDEVNWLERDRRDDLPAHIVYIDAFYMDVYEVTNQDYARFVEATGDGERPWYWPEGQVPEGEERFPVHDVTWFEAAAYCAWVGKRLPTEAEWERAARGGLDRMRFPWGNEGLNLPDDEAFAEYAPTPSGRRVHNSYPFGTAEVGSYPPNDYGLHDMIGNVWEWIDDWYDRDYYPVSPETNPQGPEDGVYKVIRGGGWSDNDERNLMAHYRNYSDPNGRAFTIGFRCARSVD